MIKSIGSVVFICCLLFFCGGCGSAEVKTDEAKKLVPYIPVFHFVKSDKAYSKEFIAEAFDALNLSLPVKLNSNELDGLDESVTFAVLGRSVLWLPNLEERELVRLREHLTRFERELSEAVEHTLHGERGIRA